MYVAALISSIDAKLPNSNTDQDKVDWINDLEQKVFCEVLNKQVEVLDDLVAEQAGYTLATGKIFEDILKVVVDGAEYYLSSPKEHTAYTYYDCNDGKITLDPVPDEAVTDGLVIVYRYKPTLKTVANKATDVLSLPDNYINLYRFYVYSMISAMRKEFGEYNNWSMLYNQEMSNFMLWANKNTPLDGAADNLKRWRW